MNLSEMLHEHFNTKVTVLFEDIDTLLRTLLSRDLPINNAHKILEFINDFVENFVEFSSSSIERGLINDCFRLSDLFLMKSRKSVVNLPFLKNHYVLIGYYGLTENDR